MHNSNMCGIATLSHCAVRLPIVRFFVGLFDLAQSLFCGRGKSADLCTSAGSTQAGEQIEKGREAAGEWEQELVRPCVQHDIRLRLILCDCLLPLLPLAVLALPRCKIPGPGPACNLFVPQCLQARPDPFKKAEEFAAMLSAQGGIPGGSNLSKKAIKKAKKGKK